MSALVLTVASDVVALSNVISENCGNAADPGLPVAFVIVKKLAAASSIDFSGPTQWMQLAPAELAGVHYFRQEQCAICHNVTGGTPKITR